MLVSSTHVRHPAIAASNAVVVLLTANAATSPIVREEVGFALGLNKYVIPLVAPELASNPTALGMLDGLEHIPFDREDFQEGLIQLTDVVNDLVKASLRTPIKGGAQH